MVSGLIEKLRIRWLLRDEYESPALRAHFARRWQVEVGLYSYGCFDPWRIPRRTRIGRYCSFAKTARILDANHPIDALTTHPFLYEARFGVIDRDLIDPPWLEIGDDVWISHNATITPGCKAIGRGAIIGAGAVVTHDVAPYAIVAGVPATQLRLRFDADTIAAIEASRWWELDKAGLADLVRRDPAAAYRPGPATLAPWIAASTARRPA
jgi:acetyltransferase-like isoleucine patch superfamily enzyme